ncbi:class I SAM-dependent methyltransferase [bacterium]|nr:class I SAM-dependent methyltransferase [bacterium]
MKKEVEVFGVTYDRYVLIQLHNIMTEELKLKRIIEMPSHGAKAAGSLYSIGFGLAGCRTALVNPELEMMYGWEELGIQDRVETHPDMDVYQAGFEEGEFDLAWNFVTWTELADPPRYLAELKRISSRYVLLVTCNNFQPGYFWHRLLHRWYGFPWTHGQVKYNHITTVRRMFRDVGLKVIDYGAIDTPGWPDPSGPRDVRLHRRFSGPKAKPDWEVPIIQYAKTGQFPGWMKLLGRWDMKFRKGVFKLPMSHLFYVLGEK